MTPLPLPLPLQVLVTVTAVFLLSCEACDYSHIDPMHTMCVFAPRMCHKKKLLRSGGLNCMEKQRIVDAHNKVRQMIALGKVAGQPAATNMKEMIWDSELAVIAQRWADQCMPGHDHRRNVDRYAVGQNVATTWSYSRTPPSKDKPEFGRHVMGWFDEVTRFQWRARDIEPFNFRMDTGHYTQLVWANTYMVGCGYTYYNDDKRGYSKLYVCNYGPGGNLVGGSLYHMGFPGMSGCHQDGLRPSSKYRGLCRLDHGAPAYPDHQCDSVFPPSMTETPPDQHKPTPAPHKSIFHEMMGDNALSNLAMHSTHLIMSGVKQTMNLATLINPIHWVNMVTKPFKEFME